MQGARTVGELSETWIGRDILRGEALSRTVRMDAIVLGGESIGRRASWKRRGRAERRLRGKRRETENGAKGDTFKWLGLRRRTRYHRHQPRHENDQSGRDDVAPAMCSHETTLTR